MQTATELSICANIYLSIFNIDSVLHWLNYSHISLSWTLTTLPCTILFISFLIGPK